MDQHRHRRKARILWVLALLALVYIALLSYLRTLTGTNMLDGIIGVLLGLYICSRPAANAVDMLFFERGALRQLSEWSGIGWLALNMLVLLLGCVVVIAGATRFAMRVAPP